MSTQDDVRRLEHDFAEAMQRLYAVGNGLARLRAQLGEAPVAHLVATAGAPAVAVPDPARPRTVPAAGAPGAARAPGAVPATVAARVPWYRREGAVTRVLAVAGAVVTLAGVAMLLVIAVRHGWFGPLARVGAGAALAAVLATLGSRQGAADLRAGRAVGAAPVALVATGGAAAYLDVVAVTQGYGWVPAVPGLALSGVVALAGLWLARRWGSELLAVVMVAGAAGFSPVVAGGPGWVLSGFLGVLSLAGWWAGGEPTRPALTVVRATPVAISLLVGAAAADSTAELLGLLAVAVPLLLATLATAALSVHRDPADVTASVSLGAAVVATLGTTANLPDPLRATLLSLTAAVLLLAASGLGRAPFGPVATHLVAVTAVGGSAAAVLAVVSGAPHRFVTTGLLLLAAGHLGSALVSRSRVTLALGAGTALLGTAAWSGHAVAMLTESSALRHDGAVAVLDSLLLVGILALAAHATTTVRGVPPEVRLASLVTAWVLGLAGWATAVVSLGVLAGERLGEPTIGFLLGQATATVSWMLASGWLLLRSLAQGRYADLALRGGLGLAAVAVAKLFLYDLAALSGVVRSVAFIATGLLLIATGSRYARAHERGHEAP